MPSFRRGRFIVLEGGEGAGKSTQIRRLATWLEERGVPHRVARGPGGTPVGEGIRDLLLERKALRIPPETELLLMLAARAAFVRDVVEPALTRGEIMLSDRFEMSTFVYQGVARGLGLDRTRALNRFATGGLEPDLVIVLDLPIEEGSARRRLEGRGDDRIEAEGAAFLGRVREGYRKVAAADPRAVLINAGEDPDAIHERIRSLLAERFPELSGAGEG